MKKMPIVFRDLIRLICLLMILQACSNDGRVVIVPAGERRAFAVVEFPDKAGRSASEALQRAVRLKQDTGKTEEMTNAASIAMAHFSTMARDEHASSRTKGRAWYNMALAYYLLSHLEEALATSNQAQLLTPDDTFISAFARYVDHELGLQRWKEYQQALEEERRSAQIRQAEYQRLLDEAHAQRAKAEAALEQARQAEARAHDSLMAARQAEQLANQSASEARKTADDLARQLAIATARFDITLEDVRQAMAQGNQVLAGILTEALLRARGNDPEVLSFAHKQIEADFNKYKESRDLAGMQTAVAAWGKTIDAVLNTVGTVKQAQAIVSGRLWLQQAEQQIAQTQRQIWLDRANRLLERHKELIQHADVNGLQQLAADIEIALASIPSGEKAHDMLLVANREITGNIKSALMSQLNNLAQQTEQRLTSQGMTLAELEQLRLAAAEQHAAAIDAVARWNIDQAIALRWARIREQVESEILKFKQREAEQNARSALLAVQQQRARIQQELSQRAATSQPTKFFTHLLDQLKQTTDQLLLLQQSSMLPPAVAKEIGEEQKQLLIAAKTATQKRSASYNLWALEALNVIYQEYRKEDEKWFEDKAIFMKILRERLALIDYAELYPETSRLYNFLWDKLWEKVKGGNEAALIDLSKQITLTPRTPITDF